MATKEQIIILNKATNSGSSRVEEKLDHAEWWDDDKTPRRGASRRPAFTRYDFAHPTRLSRSRCLPLGMSSSQTLVLPPKRKDKRCTERTFNGVVCLGADPHRGRRRNRHPPHQAVRQPRALENRTRLEAQAVPRQAEARLRRTYRSCRWTWCTCRTATSLGGCRNLIRCCRRSAGCGARSSLLPPTTQDRVRSTRFVRLPSRHCGQVSFARATWPSLGQGCAAGRRGLLDWRRHRSQRAGRDARAPTICALACYTFLVDERGRVDRPPDEACASLLCR